MKYLVPENKLFGVIYTFIDNELKDEGLIYQDAFDYDKEEWTDKMKWFYLTKYQNENVFMEYISKEWFERPECKQRFRDMYLKKAPILQLMGILDSELINKLKGFFGDLWEEPFKKWFKKNYPQFPVKTFKLTP